MNTHLAGTSFAFTAGQTFKQADNLFRLIEVHGDTAILTRLGWGEEKQVSVKKLTEDYLAGILVPLSAEEVSDLLVDEADNINAPNSSLHQPLDELSAATKQVGQKKLRYIQALKERGFDTLRRCYASEHAYNQLVAEFKDPDPPALSTIYACSLAINSNGGNQQAAYPRFKDRGGRGRKRWDPLVEDAFNEVINDLQNDSRARVSATCVLEDVNTKLSAKLGLVKNVTISPSLSTIDRRLRTIFTEYEIYERKHGKAKAIRTFGSRYPRDRAISPLEVVEFDDKDTRCYLIDEVTGLPYGRAYVTTGIDQYSYMPLGFSISERHRNEISAKTAFVQCISCKDSKSPEYHGIKYPIDQHGYPGIAIFDNALYNHSNGLQLLINEVSPNTWHAFAKPNTPTEKSAVEHFNDRMGRELLHKFAGYGGPKVTKDLLKIGESKSCETIQDFKHKFMLWVYAVYARKPRGEDGLAPIQKWTDGMVGRTQLLPARTDAVFLANTKRTEKRLTNNGLEFSPGLYYQSQELDAYKRRVGTKRKIIYRYDPNRLSEVYIFNEEAGTYFAVPSTAPEYTNGLSEYQHGLIRGYNKERKKNNPILGDYYAGRLFLLDEVAKLRSSPKKRERTQSRRIAMEVSDNTISQLKQDIIVYQTVIETEEVSEMEYVMGQLSDIELDNSDADNDDENWTITFD